MYQSDVDTLKRLVDRHGIRPILNTLATILDDKYVDQVATVDGIKNGDLLTVALNLREQVY